MRWLSNVDRLMELLFFAIHISCGQPAHVPELTTVKIRNSLFSSRSIFLMHGTIALITSYWRSQSMQSAEPSISRYLPVPVALILLKYLVLVCP
ncbi:hypothetical protein GQ54DRAFT_265700, partial [Martensiomyces pterosporus]